MEGDRRQKAGGQGERGRGNKTSMMLNPKAKNPKAKSQKPKSDFSQSPTAPPFAIASMIAGSDLAAFCQGRSTFRCGSAAKPSIPEESALSGLLSGRYRVGVRVLAHGDRLHYCEPANNF